MCCTRAYSMHRRLNIPQILNGADVCKITLIFEPCVVLGVHVPVKSIMTS